VQMDTNVLYYGENLDILRKHIPDGEIGLVYLDPPFNSNATYNVCSRNPAVSRLKHRCPPLRIPGTGVWNQRRHYRR